MSKSPGAASTPSDHQPQAPASAGLSNIPKEVAQLQKQMNAALEQLLTMKAALDSHWRELEWDLDSAMQECEAQATKAIQEVESLCATTIKESEAHHVATIKEVEDCHTEPHRVLLYPLQLLMGNIPLASLPTAIPQPAPQRERTLIDCPPPLGI